MLTQDEKPFLVVVPAFNESARIVPVIKTAKRLLDVLVVDDGSLDDTVGEAQRAGAVVLSQEKNQGKGAALRSGFVYALENGYQAVVTLDADGQHDPNEISKFLAAYRKTSAELVIGYRDFSKMPPVRKLANTMGRRLFSWALRHPIRDNQSGFRLVGRRLMAAMLDSGEKGFEFEVEMVVVCVQNQLHLEWVPIRTIYSGEGSHIQPIKHLVNFTRMILKTRRLTRMRTG